MILQAKPQESLVYFKMPPEAESEEYSNEDFLELPELDDNWKLINNFKF